MLSKLILFAVLKPPILFELEPTSKLSESIVATPSVAHQSDHPPVIFMNWFP